MAVDFQDIYGREGTMAEVAGDAHERERFYATDAKDGGTDDSGSYGYYDDSDVRHWMYTLDDDLNPQTALGEGGIFFRYSTGAGNGDIDIVLIDNDAGNPANWPKMWWDESEDEFIYTYPVRVRIGVSGGTADSLSAMILESDGNIVLQFLTPSSASQYLLFGDNADQDVGYILYQHSSDTMSFATATSVQAKLNATGMLVGTGSPSAARFEVVDATKIQARFTYDSIHYATHEVDSDGDYYITIYNDCIKGNLYINKDINPGDTGSLGLGRSGTLYARLDVDGNIALNDEIMFGVTVNAEDWGYINENGYQASTTQFRNLGIGDGKGVIFGVYSGQYQSLTLGHTTTTYSEWGRLVIRQEEGDINDRTKGITFAPYDANPLYFYIATNEIARITRGPTQEAIAIDLDGLVGINNSDVTIFARFTVNQAANASTDGIGIAEDGSTDVRMYIDGTDAFRIQRGAVSTAGIAIQNNGDIDISNYTKLGGAERLKEYSYQVTLDADDIIANEVVFNIASVDLTKIRRLVAVGYDVDLTTVFQSTDATDGFNLVPSVSYPTIAVVTLGGDWAADDTVSIMITEAQ